MNYSWSQPVNLIRKNSCKFTCELRSISESKMLSLRLCSFVTLLLFSFSTASPQFGFLNGLFGGRGGNRGGGRPQSNNFGGGRCGGGNRANHQFQGRNYLISWRLGCSSFTQGGGEAFCRSNGMRPISLDSSAKEREFLGLVSRERQRYFWTGGKVSGRSIRWPSGRRHNNVNWSHTGGWVSWYKIFRIIEAMISFLVLTDLSLITVKETNFVLLYWITFTMTEWGSMMSLVIIASPLFARLDVSLTYCVPFICFHGQHYS